MPWVSASGRGGNSACIMIFGGFVILRAFIFQETDGCPDGTGHVDGVGDISLSWTRLGRGSHRVPIYTH